MISTILVVPTLDPRVTRSVLANPRTTDRWVILPALIFVLILFLGLGPLVGLSIRLLIIFGFVSLDGLTVRDAGARLLLPVITALHEPCNSYQSLLEIRWVSGDILTLLTVTLRTHAIHDQLPFSLSGDLGGLWDPWQHFKNGTTSRKDIVRSFIGDVALNALKQNTANVLLIAS